MFSRTYRRTVEVVRRVLSSVISLFRGLRRVRTCEPRSMSVYCRTSFLFAVLVALLVERLRSLVAHQLYLQASRRTPG